MKQLIEKIKDDIACNCVGRCENVNICLAEIEQDAEERTMKGLEKFYNCRNEEG